MIWVNWLTEETGWKRDDGGADCWGGSCRRHVIWERSPDIPAAPHQRWANDSDEEAERSRSVPPHSSPLY